MSEVHNKVINGIIKYLAPDRGELPQEGADFEDLRFRLSKIIDYLINKDLNRLLNGLYRIDVSEEEVKRILSFQDQGMIAKSLAELIIQRELQKVESRRRYR